MNLRTSSCNAKVEFSRQIFEKLKRSNFIKIRPVRAELFHADGRTDRQTETAQLVAAFINFPNAPNNSMKKQLGK
jgi:hypothetical protein